ncbi:hypothetical protein LH464_15655 [Neorhizobium sp. T786]|uniref:DUF6894 family protein n=1 Tax=Pseudorhizobium xiangyangii TaxID=2883104 RepID=UPI001CFFD2E0|nr:hypothetical protein [Neorhizobium xiangyangii]MCB5203907.1 hypothetical protein [Neorhizobium xiangyangii]
MLKYHFHIRGENGELDRDERGVEFETLDEAHAEAVRTAIEMVLARPAHFHDDERVFEITDPDGLVLREVPFKDVFRLE